MTRRRHLSDEEHALWAGFVRSIKPLRKAKPAAEPPAKSPAPPRAKSSSSASPKKSAANIENSLPRPPYRSAEPPPSKSPPLAPLGRRLKKRVARGREPIDAKIDLHGMTQNEAHGALLRFLRRAQTSGARMVLVVTGKGSGSGSNSSTQYSGESSGARFGERGVLKRQVPLWLALPEFRPLIVGFEDAHIGHGGHGALYVRLRREK
jgi:DNA-nicking Smr family endonuclease